MNHYKYISFKFFSQPLHSGIFETQADMSSTGVGGSRLHLVNSGHEILDLLIGCNRLMLASWAAGC